MPEPALGALPPLQTILHLAAATTAAINLDEAYAHTFTAYLQGHEALPDSLRHATQRCLDREVLQPTLAGGLGPTPLGRLAAAAGVSFETFNWLKHWANLVAKPPTNLEATLLAALTAEMQECACWGFSGGLNDFCRALRAHADETREAGALLESLLTTGERDWRVRDRAARQTLALCRWLGPEETYELETGVRLSAARLMALGETAGWIVDTLAEIGAEQGWPLADCRRLRAHAESLALGLGVDGLALGRLKIFGMGRDHVRLLVAAALQSPTEIMQADSCLLSKLLPEKLATELLVAVQQRRKPSSDRVRTPEHGRKTDHATRRDTETLPVGAPLAVPVALALSADRPDLAVFYGHHVPLRPAEFRLLRALAEHPGKCLRYETLYDRMWAGDRFVEPGQIYSHRSRLCGKLAAALPERDFKEIVVTVPRHGLMLNLPAEEVQVS
jgi:hypothetical protein